MKAANVFLKGSKIYLRPVEPQDAPLLAACNNSPEVRLTFFTAFPTNTVQEEERIKNLYQQKDYVPLVICIKNNDQAIGITAFHRVDLVSRAAIFSIIIVDSKEWSKGYGSEATQLMLHYGFEILNLNRIQLHVFTGNEPAIRTYKKFGFQIEGTLRKAMYHFNQYCDFYVMGILRSEYYKQTRQKSGPQRKPSRKAQR